MPEAGEITEAQIRRHKGLDKTRFRSEKTRSVRFIKRGLLIARMCEYMDTKPGSWFHLSTGYNNKKLTAYLDSMKGTWPWNIEACKWTPGKILMITREQTWLEFARDQRIPVREPHLRILRLTTDECADLNSRFVRAYKRAINRLEKHHGHYNHQ